jgi:hypothetical protein
MNLGIEYLIRTGTITKFFQTPCSLCLEDWLSKRMVLSFESADGSKIKVTEWWLNRLGERGLPLINVERQVPADQVFEYTATWDSDDLFPIPYVEQPIDTYLNRYNHPMDEDSYRYLFDNHLNSHKHKMHREVWLWKSFRSLHIKKPLLPLRYYEQTASRIAHYEKLTVETEFPDLWRLWRIWKKKLLQSGEVATELIFQSRATSSSSSSSPVVYA